MRPRTIRMRRTRMTRDSFRWWALTGVLARRSRWHRWG